MGIKALGARAAATNGQQAAIALMTLGYRGLTGVASAALFFFAW